MKTWLTVPEVCEIKQVTPARIRFKVRQGHYPHTRWCTCGLRLMIKRSDLKRKPIDRRTISQREQVVDWKIPDAPPIEKRAYLGPSSIAKVLDLRSDYVVNKLRAGHWKFKVCECGKSRLVARKDIEADLREYRKHGKAPGRKPRK